MASTPDHLAVKTHPSAQYLNVSVSQLSAKSAFPYHRFVASSVVFANDNRVLLIQRAATDAGPLQWEIPGGMCEAAETVLAGAARELQEESGLVATEIRALVREESWDEDPEDPAKGRWTKFIFLVRVEKPDGEDVKETVRLDPAEHCDHVWATEKEVRDGVCGQTKLNWTYVTVKEAVLKGFEMLKM